MANGNDNPAQTRLNMKVRVADFQPKRRKCLGYQCGAWFWSAGPGNRKCKRCSVARVVVSRAEQNAARDPKLNQ
jgi:hypothetical protein